MTLDLQRLKASLLPQPVAMDFVEEDGAGQLELTPAAVLFPIVLRPERQMVLLTQRTAHLRDHAGQISFPGGRVEAEDLSPVHTALRETEEEIGLAREHIEILGFLPEYRTGTGFRVTPVVALVAPPFDLRPDPFEVAEVFEVPLAFLLDPANHKQHEMHYRGALRRYYAMPYGDYFIWGATAGMIRSLSERLGLHASVPCGIVAL
ncbi:MAG: CoA pyrophosphatase [Betaproteobacteria bacterium HGW-Betaproteobacteria-12]|nr:MAG: CoA pyrophosphatase [Betaproteobacteria bacterium HGW-Betaproteobacteria-12]